MTINGIEINETTDIKEIIIVFNSLLIQAEGLKEELVTNFSTYQSIDIHSADTLQKYKEVLQSITAIQMKSQDAFERVAKLNANLLERVTHLQKKIQDENKATYEKIKGLLYQLAPFTQEIVNESIKQMRVDTSGVEAAVREKLSQFDVRDINDMIGLIDEKSQSLRNINQTFYKNIEHLTNANASLASQNIHLEETINNMKGAIASFKKSTNRLKLTNGSAILFMGILLGVGLASFFKINALSTYYFSQYDEEKAALKASKEALEKRVLSLEGLPEFLDAHGIDIRYHVFVDDKGKSTGVPFVAFKEEQTYSENTEYTFSKAGEQYIGFKVPR